MQAWQIPDTLASIVVVALCAGWLVTSAYLWKRLARANQRVTDLDLELVGANHRLQQARDQVALLAHHDPLTGLLVRAELQRGFQTTLAIAKRTNTVFGIVLIDLPGFEAVAATHGDETADRVLAAFGLRLRTVTRDMDVVARVGAHQFAALLPRLNDTDDIEVVIRKLRAELEQQFKLAGMPKGSELGGIRVQLCFGHACFPRDGQDWTAIMKIADERLARGSILVRA
jgi:diguanylate cyclase (GGDEF)-like protein